MKKIIFSVLSILLGVLLFSTSCLADSFRGHIFNYEPCGHSWDSEKEKTDTKDRADKNCNAMWSILVREDKEQLDRIESKLDEILNNKRPTTTDDKGIMVNLKQYNLKYKMLTSEQLESIRKIYGVSWAGQIEDYALEVIKGGLFSWEKDSIDLSIDLILNGTTK